MAFTYWLPNENGEKQDVTTDNNAVIIIGANGSGKSKLGAWIEEQSFSDVHRIGGQRNLSFSEDLPLKNYAQAEALVFYGDANRYNQDFKMQKGNRWGWGMDRRFTTRLLNDFDDVLAALLALKNNENDKFVEQCRIAETTGSDKPIAPTTSVDKLKSIWETVLPQRKLDVEDSKFYAVLIQNGSEHKYSATEMSDGERAVLYLSAQVLCVPENKILIIDEPEIHLHRSIMNQLWKTLEDYRPDCLFIYITHDTQFAAMHTHAEKIWIKNYDGQKWNLERIESETLPDELLMDILGSRRNVLFVEGDNDSYDYQLYTSLYPHYLIVPCGSCSQVILRTKAFRANQQLHDFEVYGLIDRDYRSDHEIETYKADHIYTLQVAEVENLFLVEELIRYMAEHLGANADDTFSQVKSFVINTKYANMINRQICQSVVAEIKYQLSCVDISKQSEADAKTTLNSTLTSINYDSIKATQEMKFHGPLSRNNYREVLSVFNEKELSKAIGRFFGLDNRMYTSTVIRLLRGNSHNEIVNAILPYLPPEIPRE